MKYRNRLIAVLTTLLMIATIIFSFGNIAVLASEDNCQLIINYQLEGKVFGGAVFNVYRVGEKNDDGSITLSGKFKNYQVYTNTDDLNALAQTLYGYALLDAVEPEYNPVCDDNGNAVIEGMRKGVYMITGERYVDGENIYVTEPQLIFLPWWEKNQEKWNNVLKVNPKASKLNVNESIDVKVLKKWDDTYREPNRPASIDVTLLKDGVVYDEVTLADNNNWRYVWENLPSSSVWTIVEDVPNNYFVIQMQEGITRLIVNYFGNPPDYSNTVPSATTTSDSTTPSKDVLLTEGTIPSNGNNVSFDNNNATTQNSRLPQTGMLWWPVPLLILIGIVLVVLGVLKRRGEDFEA